MEDLNICVQDVVWDWKNKRWYMMTQMSAAVSYSKVGWGKQIFLQKNKDI